MTDRWKAKLQSASNPPKALRGEPTLLWTDPPFGTGKAQTRGSTAYYDDADVDYVYMILETWLDRMHPEGVVCVCLDYRAIHGAVEHIKSVGWCHRGDVVWGFGLGRARTSWWGNRHNTIATFTKSESSGLFLKDQVPTEERLAPKPGYESTKKVGSIWWKTLSNTDPERVKYPNQKPLAIIEPFIQVHTRPGDLVVDPFMGSGSTGVAALVNRRRFWGCDVNPEAVKVAKKRLKGVSGG